MEEKMSLPLLDSDAVNLLKNIYEKMRETKIHNLDEIPRLFCSDLDEVFKHGNAMSFYVLISKENLRDKKFAEATCNFEWL